MSADKTLGPVAPPQWRPDLSEYVTDPWDFSINRNVVPREEWDEAGRVDNNMSSMKMLVKQFRSAVALFDFALAAKGESFGRESDWMFLAARQGASLIYSFGRITDALNGHVNKPKVMKSLVARDLQKQANKLYLAAFPYHHDVRLGAAHPLELGKTKEGIEEHSLEHGLFIGDSLFGRRYGGTVNKQMVSYVIGDSTALVLENILTLWWFALRRLNNAWWIMSVPTAGPKLHLFNQIGCYGHEIKLTVDHG